MTYILFAIAILLIAVHGIITAMELKKQKKVIEKQHSLIAKLAETDIELSNRQALFEEALSEIKNNLSDVDFDGFKEQTKLDAAISNAFVEGLTNIMSYAPSFGKEDK